MGSRESLPDADIAGAVNVLYGSATGPNGDGDQVWTQDTNGVRGQAKPFDFLSLAMRAA